MLLNSNIEFMGMMIKGANYKHINQLFLVGIFVSSILLQGCLTRSDIGAGLGATSQRSHKFGR